VVSVAATSNAGQLRPPGRRFWSETAAGRIASGDGIGAPVDRKSRAFVLISAMTAAAPTTTRWVDTARPIPAAAAPTPAPPSAPRLYAE
jgi:hypothetical protein